MDLPAVGRTAQRLQWRFLPRPLRDLVERRTGSPVVEAHSQDAGFTPGFASVLVCEDGSRHFVKAASVKAQRMFAESYLAEIRVLRALPETVPAPRLVWALEDDWVALETSYVDGRAPRRPWSAADLDACLDACEAMVGPLTPSPLEVPAFAEEHAEVPALWDGVRERFDLGAIGEEAQALAEGFAAHTGGETAVHMDLRDDNVLIDASGDVWFCDWNWLARGPAWMDSLTLLIGPAVDDLDVEAVIAARPLLRDVDPAAIDAVLALLVGYFLHAAALPVPPSSPHLREHQQIQGEALWAWLARRRGWDPVLRLV